MTYVGEASGMRISQSRTVRAPGRISRVVSVDMSNLAVRSHRHIVVRSVPTKRSKSQTGIEKPRGVRPRTSRQGTWGDADLNLVSDVESIDQCRAILGRRTREPR
jgi:hypothetical protein